MKNILQHKLITIITIIFILISNYALAAVPIIDDAPDPDPNKVYPEITADNLDEMTGSAAVVMDSVSGRAIFSKNPEVPHYPASTTKMLTALMAVESGDLDKTIEVDERAVGAEGSAIYISEGDKMKFRDLVQATMLASGNDGALAIAYYLGHGSMENFLAQMNARAKALGATHSHFNNPHGLPDKNHYSTAMDLAEIARFAYYNPIFRAIVSKKQAVIKWQEPKDKEAEYFSTNRLMWNYDDVNGIKTGYTEQAGGCLVASATQGENTLISVVLQTIDSRSRFSESRALLDYGFKQIKGRVKIDKEDLSKKIFVHNSSMARVELVPIEDFSYPLLAGEKPEDFEYKITTDKYIDGPVPKGFVAGKILLYKKGELVGSMPLVTAEAVTPGFSIIGYLHKLIFG